MSHGGTLVAAAVSSFCARLRGQVVRHGLISTPTRKRRYDARFPRASRGPFGHAPAPPRALATLMVTPRATFTIQATATRTGFITHRFLGVVNREQGCECIMRFATRNALPALTYRERLEHGEGKCGRCASARGGGLECDYY
ncbi:unnamed protein product, partial [Iphiclides podalirius]